MQEFKVIVTTKNIISVKADDEKTAKELVYASLIAAKQIKPCDPISIDIANDIAE